MRDDFRRALRCAHHYRKLGLCPLPSKMHIKGPDLDSYAEYWESPVPESVYSEAAWRTTNIQVMTGAKTPGLVKIVVVDCDGLKGHLAWCAMREKHGYDQPPTWRAETGSGGQHYYFRLPDGTESCPSGMIYGIWDTWGDDGRGKWVKHEETRILGDNALVIAPPSIHVETKKPYRFCDGWGPRDCPLPAVAPDWLLAMPRLVAPTCIEPPKPKAPWRPSAAPQGHYGRQDVLDAIGPEKLALAQSWGLRAARSQPNHNGWVSCYAVGREDKLPSASFKYADGIYQDRKDGRTLTFFDLGVELGAFDSWQECCDWCGDRYIGAGRRARAYTPACAL